MTEPVSVLAAFIAGVISFLSPCVLPLVPAYISFITGVSLNDLKEQSDHSILQGKAFLSSIYFVLGFSVVFIILGATATWLGQILLMKLPLFTNIAGIIIIIFGLHLLGIFRIKLLYREKRFQGPQKVLNNFSSFALGLAFAFGWTPCIGPILGAILTFASTKETVWQGISLLTIYSLGLGIPFLLTSIGLNKFFNLFNQIKRYFRAIEITSGILLIIIGILIGINQFTIINSKLLYWFPFLNRFAL